MGCGPDNPVGSASTVPSGPSRASSPVSPWVLDDYAECPLPDSGTFDTSEAPFTVELDGTPKYASPDENDAESIENHENTEEDEGSARALTLDIQTVKDDNQDPPVDPELLIREPETHPISREQLMAETKGIYAGLVMVEEKCREVDQIPDGIFSLSNEQYAALFSLHHTLLNQHYDFFMASQHSSAPEMLKRLATKYVMPARMWKHAIHSFLDLLLSRLPESKAVMDDFIMLAYNMISVVDETVPQFQSTWIEAKGDLARYGMAIQDLGELGQRWRETAKQEYTRALIEKPTTGRIYHHLAILEYTYSWFSKDFFDATVSKLFYFTKSLIVKTPFFPSRDSVLTVIGPIVARNEAAGDEPANYPQTDKDHFLTAAVHLILASLEPHKLKVHGYKDNKKDHLLAVYLALGKIKTNRLNNMPKICPSAKIGLLLCQLLLGIPLADEELSPMMVAWAPDGVMADCTDSDAMSNARDIHNATIELVSTMIPYLLEEADTRDLGVWGFIYVILVFMRSLKTRPALLEWLGPAFNAKILAPFLNMLLREDETRGSSALKSASQSEIVTLCSVLNKEKRVGKYALSTEDICRKSLRQQEQQKEVERNNIIDDETVTTDGTTAGETMASGAVHDVGGDTKTPHWEQMFANPLPEHALLFGLPFAREAGPCDESGLDAIKDTGLDPPLFPNGWLKKSKYSFDETQVRDYVQDVETYYDRSKQILRLAAQLDVFFIFEIDEEGCYWISVPMASSIPKPDPRKRMPEIIEREGGVRNVYVDPSSHCAEIAREKQTLARVEERRQKEEKQKEERQKEERQDAEGVDSDGWVHVTTESLGDTESMSSRLLEGRGR